MTDREPVNIMGVIAFPEPDKSKRRIRFIDAEYNTLFYIPDGASIVMTRMDGGSVIRPCTYIDDCHTLIGSEVYHICEFAEAAQRTGTVYEPLDPKQLPVETGCYEIFIPLIPPQRSMHWVSPPAILRRWVCGRSAAR